MVFSDTNNIKQTSRTYLNLDPSYFHVRSITVNALVTTMCHSCLEDPSDVPASILLTSILRNHLIYVKNVGYLFRISMFSSQYF